MAKRTSIIRKSLIVLPYLMNGDGTAVSLMNYYPALIDNGWIVDFLNLKTKNCQWVENVKSYGGKVYELPDVNKYSKKVNCTIKEIVKQGNYDIVHVNLPGHIGYETLKIARLFRVKTRVFHAHNPKNTLNIKTKCSTILYDFLIQRESTDLIACSESAGRSRFKKKSFHILKNVIDINRFVYRSEEREKIRSKLNIEDKIVIGVVGRFAAQKNPNFLINCFAEYKKIEKKAFLLWIGDGELQKEINEKMCNLGLSGSYFFAGRQENVENWYSAMDLFFLPSKFEGMGIVFLEAQCTGLPCLGSKSVPIETEVTELMHRMDLKQSATDWASEMKKIIEVCTNRYSRTQEFIKAGYTHEATKYDLINLYNTWIDGE